MKTKKLLFTIYICLSFLILNSKSLKAQCAATEHEYFVDFHGDIFSGIDNFWAVYSADFSIYFNGTNNSSTFCIDTSYKCLQFDLEDYGGDGFIDTTSYVDVYVDSVLLMHISGNFGWSKRFTINCPQGFACDVPVPVYASQSNINTAPAPDYWYTFVADSTGNYSVSCCGLGNTCDSRIYVYQTCPYWLGDDYLGTYSYGDNGCDSLQGQAFVAMAAGDTILIRIGDSLTACAGSTINWQIWYDGPIHGCMDSTSCNFNPLATIADSCYYYPNVNCNGPDLIFVRTDIINTLQISQDFLFDPCYQNENCVTGIGQRDLMKFTGHLRNIGVTDYYWGPIDTANVNSQYVYDPCHHHFHVKNIAKFSLYDSNMKPQNVGFKNSYGIINMACVPGTVATGSGPGMYLAAGCGDIYGFGTPCQWVDVTEIDTGDYMLVVTVNFDKKADKLGRHEMNYANNSTHVCLHIGIDSLGHKKLTSIDSTCTPFIDCNGDTLGLALKDCNGVCNGSTVLGDVNANLKLDTADVSYYLDGIVNDTLATTSCNDLNGDNNMTVSDAAKAWGCIRASQNNVAPFITAVLKNHLCELPYNVNSHIDTVTFGIANLDKTNKYFDLTVYNPDCRLLAFELLFSGVTIDYVENLALGNYTPILKSSATGHVLSITSEDISLFRQLAPLHLVRIHYLNNTAPQVCLDSVIALMNEYYNQVDFKTSTTCIPFVVAGVDEYTNTLEAKVFPNPANNYLEIYLDKTTFHDASITLQNMMGQQIMEKNKIENPSNYTKMDISNIAPGVYQLTVVNGKWKFKTKVVKL